MPVTKEDQFEQMVLVRAFYSLDMAAGTLIRHEVRRDPVTGLTLTRKQPVDKPQGE